MDGLSLLPQAQEVGLKVVPMDGVLKIRGPRKFADLSRQLIERKAEIVAAFVQFESLRIGPGTETQENLAIDKVSVPSRPAHVPTVARRLIGNGFPPHPTEIPPASILATQLAVCPRCSSRPVLPELREMTGGQRYSCWAAGEGAQS